MKDRRKTLTLRVGVKTLAEREADNSALLEQAIHHRLCVRWSHNGTTVLGAPQIWYRRTSGLCLDAVVIERFGMPRAEMALGSFELASLSHIVLTTETFVPDTAVDSSHVRYRKGVLASALG